MPRSPCDRPNGRRRLLRNTVEEVIAEDRPSALERPSGDAALADDTAQAGWARADGAQGRAIGGGEGGAVVVPVRIAACGGSVAGPLPAMRRAASGINALGEQDACAAQCAPPAGAGACPWCGTSAATAGGEDKVAGPASARTSCRLGQVASRRPRIQARHIRCSQRCRHEKRYALLLDVMISNSSLRSASSYPIVLSECLRAGLSVLSRSHKTSSGRKVKTFLSNSSAIVSHCPASRTRSSADRAGWAARRGTGRLSGQRT